MLQVSKKVEYALRAAVYLAGHDEDRMVSFREVADSQDVPPEFLAKILRTLVCAGIVDSMRGAHGGYKLARPASKITFLEVIEAADGAIALNDCCDNGRGCDRAPLCSMESIWRRGEQAMKDVFAGVRLSDIACQDVLKASLSARGTINTEAQQL
jgi:Rrf2 family protein